MKQSSYTFDIGSAITPLDGRNRYKLSSLSSHYSDFVLTRLRVKLETTYLIRLSHRTVIRTLTKKEVNILEKITDDFDFEDYKKVRHIEQITNHETKAAEEFVRNKLQRTSLRDVAQMVHFGLTSDDINNLAYTLMIRDVLQRVILPELDGIAADLKLAANRYKTLPMLSRTHGQPAAPTTLGKEFAVYYQRLKEELEVLKQLPMKGKLTGNTGNLNAHKFIFPKINWLKFSNDFVQSLGLTPDLVTTQIEPYDSLVRLFASISRINNILTGLCVDCWWYISLGYFKQRLVPKEVGSTALPHKINPIYFEGAEGGFGVANALLEFYARKLSYSRLQRDLSDSTVRRSFGIAFGYCLLSYQSVHEALTRIDADEAGIKLDLEQHVEVISEAIQNFLRAKNSPDAYDQTKRFFRGRHITFKQLAHFVAELPISRKDKIQLSRLLPANYTGYASDIVDLLS